MSGAFVDLRLNSRDDQGNEGFWPSFTDIMTVVVMIFMMAMLLLLLKNMRLVHQLQATLAAERTASEQASTATSKNANLQSKLRQDERELGMLQMQLMNMSDERDRLSSALATSNVALAKVTGERNNVASRLATNQEQLTLKNTQYAGLEAELGRNREALTRMQKNEVKANRQLASLTGEYTTLKFKYDKLVRPARTAKGKYVVTVRVGKVHGRMRTELKIPGQAGFSAVSRTRLDQQLGGLRQQHPHDMYVKIIFPKDSGLSYSEAWKLTESLLRKYDYYYHAMQ